MKNKTSNSFLIRLLYLIPLCIFIFILISNWNDLSLSSSFGIKYVYVLIIPSVIFAYQTIRNSIIGWTLVMIMYSIFLAAWSYKLIEEFSLVGAKYSVGQYVSWWLLVILYLLIGFLYLKYRSRKRII